MGTTSVRLCSTIAGNGGVRSVVDNLIASKKVMVFSKSYCPYCRKAKQVFKSYQLDPNDYHVWEIDHEPNMAAIQTYLQTLTGDKSVPRVFIHGKFIGGGTDTEHMHNSGELAELLNK